MLLDTLYGMLLSICEEMVLRFSCHMRLSCSEDGYDIEYVRVPVTDEKAPKDNDVDLLVQRVWRIAQEDETRMSMGQQPSAIVFNCQMGRGRTTTGMIIASMVLLRKHIRTNPGTGDWVCMGGLVCA